MKNLPPQKITQFRSMIYDFYQTNHRSFPWRETTNPYLILVSEIMLQQTQTDRVIPKFEAFITSFPTVHALAAATPAQVIRHWQGLGYNRRGLNLHRSAAEIVEVHQGIVPDTESELISLPGIGPYTAAAVLAFAYNQPSIVIETNIRAVYIHHFLSDKKNVDDSELRPLIEQTLDRQEPRKWYSALMDYGADLKSRLPNPSRASRHHSKQSKFEGSFRQLRGQILKHLAAHQTATFTTLATETNRSVTELKKALVELEAEGFINRDSELIRLRD